MNTQVKSFKTRVIFSLVFLFSAVAMFAVVNVNDIAAQQNTADEKAVMSEEEAGVARFAMIAAAAAFSFGALGAGFAIASVGSAAMGAIAEKPEVAPQALIFIALAEGLVVFGFITALMILGKV